MQHKPIFVPILALVSLLSLCPLAAAQTISAVADMAEPSIAVILASGPDGVKSGTGFLAADGVVITAYHVVARANRIVLKFPRYVPMDANILNSDPVTDVAALGIPSLSPRTLPLGDLTQLHVGEQVVAIGYPLIQMLGAETPTVTEGIISAIRPDALQIQVPINPGNSGGPILNLRGEVIGIVESRLTNQQQINFATPITAAMPLLRTYRPQRVPLNADTIAGIRAVLAS
jgi:S1-C subfamily serine protease